MKISVAVSVLMLHRACERASRVTSRRRRFREAKVSSSMLFDMGIRGRKREARRNDKEISVLASSCILHVAGARVGAYFYDDTLLRLSVCRLWLSLVM